MLDRILFKCFFGPIFFKADRNEAELKMEMPLMSFKPACGEMEGEHGRGGGGDEPGYPNRRDNSYS